MKNLFNRIVAWIAKSVIASEHGATMAAVAKVAEVSGFKWMEMIQKTIDAATAEQEMAEKHANEGDALYAKAQEKYAMAANCNENSQALKEAAQRLLPPQA